MQDVVSYAIYATICVFATQDVLSSGKHIISFVFIILQIYVQHVLSYVIYILHTVQHALSSVSLYYNITAGRSITTFTLFMLINIF